MEVWKPIPGYDGLYEASTYGKIRSLDRVVTDTVGRTYLVRGKILKSSITANCGGYCRVSLRKDKSTHDAFVHRLVALTFIPNPNQYADINHIDGVKYNNHVSNLEWCTRSHNIKHAWDTGLNHHSEKRRVATSSLFSKPVYCSNTDITYSSHLEASIALGVSQDQILASLRRGGHVQASGSYQRWRFFDNKLEYEAYVQSYVPPTHPFENGSILRDLKSGTLLYTYSDVKRILNMSPQTLNYTFQYPVWYVPRIDTVLCMCDDQFNWNMDTSKDKYTLNELRVSYIRNSEGTMVKCSNGQVYPNFFIAARTLGIPSTAVRDAIQCQNGYYFKLGLYFEVVPMTQITDEQLQLWVPYYCRVYSRRGGRKS